MADRTDDSGDRMSEHEFEIYLELLARTLKLSDAQRRSISAELRDHMEQRLDELTAKGIDRDRAIRAALNEFGQANALAHDLSRSSTQHKRSSIMKTSLGTLVAGCLIALLFTYALPDNKPGVPQNPATQAQQPLDDAQEPASPDAGKIQIFDIRDLSDQPAKTRFDYEKLTRLRIELYTAKLRYSHAEDEYKIIQALRDEGRIPVIEMGEARVRYVTAKFAFKNLEDLYAYGQQEIASEDFTDLVKSIRVVALSDIDPRRYAISVLNRQLIVKGDAQVHRAVEDLLKTIREHRPTENQSEGAPAKHEE